MCHLTMLTFTCGRTSFDFLRRQLNRWSTGTSTGFPRGTDYIIYPFRGRSTSDALAPYSLVG